MITGYTVLLLLVEVERNVILFQEFLQIINLLRFVRSGNSLIDW